MGYLTESGKYTKSRLVGAIINKLLKATQAIETLDYAIENNIETLSLAMSKDDIELIREALKMQTDHINSILNNLNEIERKQQTREMYI